MKFRSLDVLATTAITLGTGQLIMHAIEIYNSNDVSSYNFPSVFVGITASLLWTLYQFNVDGLNYSAVYSGFGLVVQLYILQKLIVNRRSAFGTRNKNSTSNKRDY